MGGAVAVDMAAFLLGFSAANVVGVASIAPQGVGLAYYGVAEPWAQEPGGRRPGTYEVATKLLARHNVPLLLMAGEVDTRTEPGQAKQVFNWYGHHDGNASRPPLRQLLVFPGEDHAVQSCPLFLLHFCATTLGRAEFLDANETEAISEKMNSVLPVASISESSPKPQLAGEEKKASKEAQTVEKKRKAPKMRTRVPVEAGLHKLECLGCKDKVILMVLEMFGVGFLGADRLYLGDTVAGVLKMVTCGGFGVWAFADWFVIVTSALERKESINSLGLKKTFHKTGIGAARVLAIFAVPLLAFQCFICCLCFQGALSHRCCGVGSKVQLLGTSSRQNRDLYAVHEAEAEEEEDEDSVTNLVLANLKPLSHESH